MGLFRRSATKPTRAEKKAGRREAKAERKMQRADAKVAAARSAFGAKSAKADARVATVRQKAQDKADTATAKAQAKSDRKAKKVTEAGTVEKAAKVTFAETVERSPREPMTAKRAKRLIGVGKVVAPIVVPYALAAANTARGAWDSRRAARLGVAPDQLGAFAGPGGALHARLSHVADALTKLEATTEGKPTSAAKAFADRTGPRLADLSVAVRAAEQMPTNRRRAAYKAIGQELDIIESTLLDHLGVSSS